MSEYTAPEKVSNFEATKLLENVTDSTIMLEVFDNTEATSYSAGTIVKPVNSDEVLFYDDVVVKDITSPSYNEDIIDSYISTGILSGTTLLPSPPKASVDGVLGSNHTLSKILRKTTQVNQDSHLEIIYATDTNNNVKIIVYRDLDGVSYSLDLGKSSIKIPATGLLYPNEITSIAIQLYQYETANGIPKIWIGTIREGLLSYTIGDSSWASEVDMEKTDTSINGTFLFRRSLKNDNFNSTDPIIQQTQNTRDRYIPGNYEPIYILGIINNPVDAGVPLCLYVNTHKEDIGTGKLALYPFTLYRYLLSTVKKYTFDTTYQVWRHTLRSVDTNWTSYKQNKITYNEIVDVLKSVQYQPSAAFDTTTSQILTATSVYSRKFNKFCVELLKLNATSDINGSGLELTITKDLTIDDSICIDANKFTGLSTYKDNIFITEKDKIWRYSNSWRLWFDAKGTTPEYNFRLTSEYRFAITNAISYLSGLRGFGILSGKDNKSFIGILNTDFGHLYFDLTSSTADTFLPVSGSKLIRKDLFNTSVKDFQVISEASLVISCGLATEPIVGYLLPDTFGDPTRYSLVQPKAATQLPSNLSDDIKTKFYKNYISGTDTNAVLINKNTLNYGKTNTDQLYTTTDTENVAILKALSERITFVDGHDYSWIVPTDISDIGDAALADLRILRNYLNCTIKYNRLKFLLRATESLALKDYVLEEDVEIPSIPEIDYQILGVIPPALPDDVSGVSQIRVIISSDINANTINYIGPIATSINPIIISDGVVRLEGIGTIVIPIISSGTAIHIPYFGTSDITIPIISSGLAYLPVTGDGISSIAVGITAIGETMDFVGTANIHIPLLVDAIGGFSDTFGSGILTLPSLQSSGTAYIVPTGLGTLMIEPLCSSIGLLEPQGTGDPVIDVFASGIGYMDPVGWSRTFIVFQANGNLYHIPFIGSANSTLNVSEESSGVHIPYIGSGSDMITPTISSVGGHGVSGTGTETSSVLCSGTGTHS